jgi:Tol biopolymer transport system component
MRRTLRTFFILVPLVVIVGLFGCRRGYVVRDTGLSRARPQSARHAADLGKIAFTRRRGEHSEIWVMNADGRGQARLSTPPAADSRPMWSPDGTRIAFISKRDGNAQIYVMNADGSQTTRLTTSRATDWLAGWSSDGTRILFTRRRGVSVTAPEEIWAVPAAGGRAAQLTGHRAGDSEPAWSPNGERIAFVRRRDGHAQVYASNTDGTHLVQLTNGRGDSWGPAWSPFGDRIAFVAARGGIGVTNAAGTSRVILPGSRLGDTSPVWSPDGQRMIVTGSAEIVGEPRGYSDVGREMELYLINVVSAGRCRLTADAAWDAQPVWSPDGAQIAFTTDRDIDREIYVMNADGSGQANITNHHTTDDQDPAWLAPAQRHRGG